MGPTNYARLPRWLVPTAVIIGVLLVVAGSYCSLQKYRLYKRSRYRARYEPGCTPEDLRAYPGGVGLEDFDLERLSRPTKARLGKMPSLLRFRKENS